MSVQERVCKTPQLKLSLADYNTNGGSIDCGGDGTKFAFTIWPISDATVAALERRALEDGKICLICSDQPLVFDLVGIERMGRERVRIVGRICRMANADGVPGNISKTHASRSERHVLAQSEFFGTPRACV
jgi:hypothetical protein